MLGPALTCTIGDDPEVKGTGHIQAPLAGETDPTQKLLVQVEQEGIQLEEERPAGISDPAPALGWSSDPVKKDPSSGTAGGTTGLAEGSRGRLGQNGVGCGAPTSQHTIAYPAGGGGSHASCRG